MAGKAACERSTSQKKGSNSTKSTRNRTLSFKGQCLSETKKNAAKKVKKVAATPIKPKSTDQKEKKTVQSQKAADKECDVLKKNNVEDVQNILAQKDAELLQLKQKLDLVNERNNQIHRSNKELLGKYNLERAKVETLEKVLKDERERLKPCLECEIRNRNTIQIRQDNTFAVRNQQHWRGHYDTPRSTHSYGRHNPYHGNRFQNYRPY